MKKLQNEMNRAFSKEEVQMAKKMHEEMFNILGNKRNANQNCFKIHLIPVRMAIIKNNNNKCW
jgi:diadenosine tetraphosphate (Ap4A) HIT family hydrolase